MTQPNIVVFLADDLGYSDLGCYGGELETPVLDKLGREGVRFAQFYNTARCSPSRASLLTGKHPHQVGIGVLNRPDLPDGYPGDLCPRTPTVAELLRKAGWTTWLSGKWHLSRDPRTPNGSWPTRRGFERFFGTLAGCSSYFDPQTLMQGESPAPDAKEDEDFYYTDAIGSRAAEWITEHHASGASQPFFLYVAFTAPHWPLHARPGDIAAQRGKFDAGWDRLREQRLARMEREGLIPPGTDLSQRDPSQPAWEEVAEPGWEASRMEAYAAQVAALDRGVGRVLDALELAGMRDDTLVLFLSDNGASAEELPIGEAEEFKTNDEVLSTGTRAGLPIRIGNSPDITPGSEDTYASYGVPWANLSNAPLRKYKRWVHEGGIAAPLLVSWPNGGLKDGSVAQTPFQLVDILPTLLEAAGVASSQLEGRSMLPALRGEAVEPADLYWEHVGNCAIRRGPWKLVRSYSEEWELYDLELDRTELHDLAGLFPGLVADLSGAWEDWAARVGVLDWGKMVARYEERGLTAAHAEE